MNYFMNITVYWKYTFEFTIINNDSHIKCIFSYELLTKNIMKDDDLKVI